MKGDPKPLGFSTRAIHAGQPPDPTTGAVVVPIFQTSTFVHDYLGEERSWGYSRQANPTRTALEDNVAALEGGLSGHAFASGMAAISALLTLVKTGEHVVVSRDLYGGTRRLFSKVLVRSGVEFTWVDTSDLDALEAAIRPETRLVYTETPANPRMTITDIAAAASITHRHGALLAVDNSLLSPFFQRPLALGADVVVHSTTKFLNGHSDSLGGVLVTSRADVRDWLAFAQGAIGGVLAPFECFLVLRGIKTLAVRMRQHEVNTRQVARFLAEHPRVGRVLYPGLEDHPGHALHTRQATGFGAVLTIDLGSFEAAKRFLDRLRVFSLAEGLGGVESLACHSATMTYGSLSDAEREQLGIAGGLARLSVGIEEVEDLLEDLEQALAGA
ncbi:MAG: PLP-dependent transferase [Thermoanaerobaculia bacterium]|nr:PLP-dependent transferase [Thermoanaerobaculia bacterium]